MSAKYIFDTFGRKASYRPSQSAERDIIASYVNSAAREVYNQSDLPELMKEVTVSATPGGMLIMDRQVGEIRAMREEDSRLPWTLRDAYSKYKIGELNAGLWFSWRVVGKRPLLVESMATGLVAAVTPVIDATVTVNILGVTATASRIGEDLPLTALTNASSRSYTDILAIRKSGQTDYDITIRGADATTIAVIPNNQLSSEYLWVDVSSFPGGDTGGTISMEVLYKEAYQNLYDDSDSFAGDAYDDIVVDRAIALWCADNDRTEEAILRDRKATREMGRKIANDDRGQVSIAKFAPHPHDSLIPRAYGYRRRVPSRWYR